MTKKEVEEKYLAGEKAVRIFAIRTMFHELGGKKITESQYKYITKKYKDKSTFINDFTGITKHIYQIK